jgi:sterol desaturase/sphingolipid hydroxylase (fatty acid hydroxylase superfamily)
MPWIRIESGAYWFLFVASFIGVAIWESFRPKGDLRVPAERRWSRHGVLLIMCSVISVGLYRVSPVIMAAAVAGSRFGVLNKPWLPFPARCILTVLVLDLVRYTMHRANHAVPFLWRVHQVHHSDPDFDVSTGLRAHPIEVILMQGANLAAVAILAPPLLAVLIAELTSCFQSFFGHANASLPGWAEKPLRWVFVTPDMHRIHHSEQVWEQSRNLGDAFPWWDRLFRTYLAAPAAGQGGMIVGLKGFQNDRSLDLAFVLLQPFRLQPQEIASSDSPVTGVD